MLIEGRLYGSELILFVEACFATLPGMFHLYATMWSKVYNF